MSRRRATSGRESGFPTGNPRVDAAPTPADLYAGVNVVDPAGHRLVTFGRYFRDTEVDETWWDAKTRGKSVRFSADHDEAGRWTTLVFDCKTCRDQGREQTTHIAYDDVEKAVTAVWDVSASSGVPKRSDITTSV